MDYGKLANNVINGSALSIKEAMDIIKTSDKNTFELLAAANNIKNAFKGGKVKLCAIVNAKSGKCSENCSFCAQSAHHNAKAEAYPLMDDSQIFEAAKKSEKNMKATCFSIVTSGKSVFSNKEIDTIGTAIKEITDGTDMNRCVSLGTLSRDQIKHLKSKGLTRLHHNLESSESFFDSICTTHTYEERLNTIRLAKEEGLEVCSGGIFGLGETLEQRVEFGITLRGLGVESVPINILNPIPGTPAAVTYKPMKPLEVLRLVATYRFLMPKSDIGIFGGREKALGSLQPLMFLAGANVTLIGDYLTTKGQEPSKDLRMIEDLGLEISS